MWSIKMLFHLLICLALVAVLINAAAVVPQVALCDDANCPMVSRIGLGTLHLGDKIGGLPDPVRINEWVRAGVDLGINLLDCADVYPVKGGDAGDSAILLGKALKMTPGLRNKVVIVAKIDLIFPTAVDTSAEHIKAQVDWFLESLQTNYLDIVLLHYPNSFTNPVEVAQTFSELKLSGKVRHFGVSNHYPSHFDTIQKSLTRLNTGIRLVTNEIELSVWNPSYMNYNSDLVDHAMTNGYRNLGWGGLAGDPTGGLNRLFAKPGVRSDKILKAIGSVGDELGVKDPAVMALAWSLSHPSGFIPLIGTTQVSRVQSLVAALDIAKNITSVQWWKIGSAGGLCQLADTQCNYKDY